MTSMVPSIYMDFMDASTVFPPIAAICLLMISSAVCACREAMPVKERKVKRPVLSVFIYKFFKNLFNEQTYRYFSAPGLPFVKNSHSDSNKLPGEYTIALDENLIYAERDLSTTEQDRPPDPNKRYWHSR